MSDKTFTIAVATNDEEVLRENLLSSPGLLDGGHNQLLIKRGFSSASLACNSAIEEAENDIIIFVHQDVYLPVGWFRRLQRCLVSLERTSPDWGVLGCFGSRKGAEGGLGRVYTCGLGRHGRPLAEPERVETLDEIVLIIRKSSGLRFDPDLPHFHLYGADICLSARANGMMSYAFQGFCVHNTNQLLSLPAEFYTCYHYIRKKWARYLPIYTSCITISLFNEELYRKRLRESVRRLLRRTRGPELRVRRPELINEGS